MAAGVKSLKIEGRLKTPEYVANITSHYRKALTQACNQQTVEVTAEAKREMELSFSRGFSPGWLGGNDHKRLVPGLHSSKRGIELGRVRRIDGQRAQVRLAAPIALGDGLSLDASQLMEMNFNRAAGSIPSLGLMVIRQPAAESDVVWIGFGRGEIDWQNVQPGDRVFKNDDPQLNRRLRKTFSSNDPLRRQPLRMHVHAVVGKPLALTASLRNGLTVDVCGETPLEKARKRPIETQVLREKLGRLGGTFFELDELDVTVQGQPMVPMAMLNQMRREAVERLNGLLKEPQPREVSPERGRALLSPIPAASVNADLPDAGDSHLAILCRDLQQLRVLCDLGVDLIYTDFHDVRDYREAVSICRGNDIRVGLASVRMQKPGEMGLLRFWNAILLIWYSPEIWPHCTIFMNLVSRQLPTSRSMLPITVLEWIRDLGVTRDGVVRSEPRPATRLD